MLELCTGGELFDRIIEYGHLTEKQALRPDCVTALVLVGLRETDLSNRDFSFLSQPSLILSYVGPLYSDPIIHPLAFSLRNESTGSCFF